MNEKEIIRLRVAMWMAMGGIFDWYDYYAVFLGVSFRVYTTWFTKIIAYETN